MHTTCPGGGRVWPKEGYWAPGEFAGFVRRCSEPTERCLGTIVREGRRSAACATGYTGEYCGTCSANFYQDEGGFCRACNDVTAKALADFNDAFKIVSTMFTLLVPVYAMIWAESTFLSIGLVLGIVGSIGGTDIAPGMQSLWRSLQLFNFNVYFLQPGCRGTSNVFVEIFWANLWMVGTYVLPAIGLLLLAALLALLLQQHIDHLPEERVPTFLVALLEWHDHRWYLDRCLLLLAYDPPLLGICPPLQTYGPLLSI